MKKSLGKKTKGKSLLEKGSRKSAKERSKLAQRKKEELVRMFGKWGRALYDRARGIDESPVITEWDPKQMGCEETFERDLTNISLMERKLSDFSLEVASYLKKDKVKGRTVTLKVKYADFTVITRSHTLQVFFDDERIIYEEVVRLLKTKTEAGRRPIRLLGVSVSNFQSLEEESHSQKREPDLFSQIDL